jgi:trigger factor
VPEAPPEVKIEEVGPATKRLTITVSSDAVQAKLQESMGTLAAEAVLPGFRKGKAPKQLLEKRFGTNVRSEAKNQLIADAYGQAVEAHKIQPVGDPEPTDAEIDLVDGKPLTFVVEVEVIPEFEPPDLEGIEIMRPQMEITEALIDHELQRQLLRMGTSNRIDADLQAGDRVAAAVTVSREGQEAPDVSDDNALLVVPPADEGGPVLGLYIDDLGKRLAGQRVGETLTIETTGPEGHELEDLRGAKLAVSMRLTAAERPEPVTKEQMIEAFGLGNEANLHEQIKLALEHQRDEEQAAAMREQVHRALQNAVEFELPVKLSARQVARNLEGLRFELLNQGLGPDEVETRLAKVRTDSEAQTRQRLKLFFLLHRLADHFKIEVSEQEVNGRIAAIAGRHGQRPEQLRAELVRTGRVGEVARMVREHKTADRVIAQAKVKEISAEEWNELVRAQEGGPTAKKTTTKKTKKKTAKTAAGGTKKKAGSKK